MNVLANSEQYKKRPSEIINITDEYTAYCFDTACTFIISKIKDDKKPFFDEDKKENTHLNEFMKMAESLGAKELK